MHRTCSRDASLCVCTPVMLGVMPIEKTQKEIEKRQLEVFKDLYSGFPEGRLIASEEPDFIVHASIKVGIELTSLFWGEGNNHIPRQAQENIRYKICQKAREEYEKRCSPKIHVSVHFNEQFTLKKQDISSLAKRVVDFISNNMPREPLIESVIFAFQCKSAVFRNMNWGYL